jgi:aminoglycoside phosphotransferase (APT) family kinase protein
VGALGRKLGEGREAEIFAWDEGLVVRLMRDPTDNEKLDREEAAVRAAAALGAPVPAVHERVEVEGRPGIVMQAVDGPDQLTLLGSRPWRVVAEARALGRLHARLHAVRAPEELPDLVTGVRSRIESAPGLPPDLRRFALAELDDLPRGDALCHGDFYPGNVLVGRDGRRVIDWVGATRGAAHADVARTLLLLRLGTPPPGTPALARALDGVGRRVITRDYTRRYARVRALDEELLERWLAVVAADRLADRIGNEQPALVGIVRAAAT